MKKKTELPLLVVVFLEMAPAFAFPQQRKGQEDEEPLQGKKCPWD